MKKTLYSLFVLIALSIGTSAQTTLFEDNFNDGIDPTWTLIDNDGNTPQSQVNFVTDAWVQFEDDDSTNMGDSVAVSTSYYTTPSASSDYLITPAITLGATGNILSWQAKSFDGSFPDSYRIRFSTTTNDVAGFDAEANDTAFYNIPNQWETMQLNLNDLGYGGQTIYIAFENISDDKYLLMLDNVIVQEGVTVGIEQIESENVSIYPNPAKDILFVAGNESFTSMNIYNVGGQLIKSLSNRNAVNIHNLEPGMYIIELISAEGTTQKRFLKN